MKTIIDKFLDISKKYPENMAVSDEFGGITYKTLDEFSDLLSKKVKEKSGDSLDGSCIGIIMPRKKEIMAAILGVLRSGNHYVFIDPDAPKSRRDFILKDAGVKCIISSKEVRLSKVIVNKSPVIYMEDALTEYEKGARGLGYNLSSIEKTAFIVYTSGSTGKPKGVIESHRFIIHLLKARSELYKLNKSDCVGNMTSFSYAAVTYALYAPLTIGCNHYIFSREDILNHSILREKIIKQNITAMFMVPGVMSEVLKTKEKLPLKCVFLSGEKLKNFPDVNIKFFEAYGSTEASIVLGHRVEKNDPWNFLGKTRAGSIIYLLDEKGKLIDKPGITGEAYVVNNALSLGYVNLKKETSKKFTDCPFKKGKKMFRTGDMMWFDEDHNYYFAGRDDGMVKINGQRVELGEIEAVAAGFEGILDAACLVKKIKDSDILTCFYIQKENVKEVSHVKLSEYMENKLPGYMVPTQFVCLSEFPKNAHGKTDRKALAEFVIKADTENEKPKNDTERVLLKEAKKLLPDMQFGVTDDLFMLGMTSLTAVKFVEAISKFISGITVSQVMRNKNIRKIISEKKEVISYYKKYDKKKPVLVLIHGIIPLRGLQKVYGEWSSVFNLLIIEPFLDHIYTEIKHYDFNELTDYYMEIIENKLPKGVNPWCFAGFSFAGESAVALAARWKEKYKVEPYVFMGDTNIHMAFPGKKVQPLTGDSPIVKKMLTEDAALINGDLYYTQEELADRITKSGELIVTKKNNVTYEGPVIYISAGKNADKNMQSIKLPIVKALYKNINIMDFKNFSHCELFLKEEPIRICKNIFRMLLNKKGI